MAGEGEKVTILFLVADSFIQFVELNVMKEQVGVRGLLAQGWPGNSNPVPFEGQL